MCICSPLVSKQNRDHQVPITANSFIPRQGEFVLHNELPSGLITLHESLRCSKALSRTSRLVGYLRTRKKEQKEEGLSVSYLDATYFETAGFFCCLIVISVPVFKKVQNLWFDFTDRNDERESEEVKVCLLFHFHAHRLLNILRVNSVYFVLQNGVNLNFLAVESPVVFVKDCDKQQIFGPVKNKKQHQSQIAPCLQSWFITSPCPYMHPLMTKFLSRRPLPGQECSLQGASCFVSPCPGHCTRATAQKNS